MTSVGFGRPFLRCPGTTGRGRPPHRRSHRPPRSASGAPAVGSWSAAALTRRPASPRTEAAVSPNPNGSRGNHARRTDGHHLHGRRRGGGTAASLARLSPLDVPSPAPAANGETPVARLDAGRSRLGATGALLALG